MHGGPWGALKDPWGGLLKTPKVIIIVQNHFHISSKSLSRRALGGRNFWTDSAIWMPFEIMNLQKIWEVVYFIVQIKICNICCDICTTRFYYFDCSWVPGTCKHVCIVDLIDSCASYGTVSVPDVISHTNYGQGKIMLYQYHWKTHWLCRRLLYKHHQHSFIR